MYLYSGRPLSNEGASADTGMARTSLSSVFLSEGSHTQDPNSVIMTLYDILEKADQ